MWWQKDPDQQRVCTKKPHPLVFLTFPLCRSSPWLSCVVFHPPSRSLPLSSFCSSSRFYLCAYLFFWTKVSPYCLMLTHSFPLMVIPHLTAGRWNTEASPIFLICRQKSFSVVNMFLADLESAVSLVAFLGEGTDKLAAKISYSTWKWHQKDRKVMYSCVFVCAGGQGSFQLINSLV